MGAGPLTMQDDDGPPPSSRLGPEGGLFWLETVGTRRREGTKRRADRGRHMSDPLALLDNDQELALRLVLDELRRIEA